MAAENQSSVPDRRLVLIVRSVERRGVALGVWRYQPPTKVRTGEYDRCFRPDGCLLLSEAINCYGKACVDGWTGEEIKARLGLDNDPPPFGQ